MTEFARTGQPDAVTVTPITVPPELLDWLARLAAAGSSNLNRSLIAATLVWTLHHPRAPGGIVDTEHHSAIGASPAY